MTRAAVTRDQTVDARGGLCWLQPPRAYRSQCELRAIDGCSLTASVAAENVN